MRKLAWLTCTTLALTLGACGDDGGSDDNNSSDPSSSSGPTTNDPTVTTSMSTSMSTTVTTEDPSSSSDPTDTASSSEGSSSSGPDPDSSSGSDSGSESGGLPEVCQPDVDDDECATCTKTMCCEELDTCYANPDCACVVGCVSKMGLDQQDACEEICKVKDTPAEGTALQTCVATSGCLAACVGA